MSLEELERIEKKAIVIDIHELYEKSEEWQYELVIQKIKEIVELVFPHKKFRVFELATDASVDIAKRQQHDVVENCKESDIVVLVTEYDNYYICEVMDNE